MLRDLASVGEDSRDGHQVAADVHQRWVRSIAHLGPGTLLDGQARLLEGGHVAAVLKLRASGNAASRSRLLGGHRPVRADR